MRMEPSRMRLVASMKEIFLFHEKCTSVNIAITNSLNSLPSKLFIFFPRGFLFLFQLGPIPLSSRSV